MPRGVHGSSEAEALKIQDRLGMRRAFVASVYMAKWTVTSSKGIGVTLSWFLMNMLLLRTFLLMDDLRAFRYGA